MLSCQCVAEIAQLAERALGKCEVPGSIPGLGSKICRKRHRSAQSVRHAKDVSPSGFVVLLIHTNNIANCPVMGYGDKWMDIVIDFYFSSEYTWEI